MDFESWFLPWSGWQMFKEITCHKHVEVQGRAGAFADPMIAVGIRHVLKRFAQFDQSIYSPLRYRSTKLSLLVGVPK